MRVDLWLDVACLFKTRSEAQRACGGGKVDVNGASAKAHRDKKWGEARWNMPPSWPWCLDETELGTADFRAIKHNIYEAALLSPDGSGISAHANADAHFRATLAPGGVAAHLLWRCPLGQVPLKSNDHLQERFAIVLRTTR